MNDICVPIMPSITQLNKLRCSVGVEDQKVQRYLRRAVYYDCRNYMFTTVILKKQRKLKMKLV